MKDVPFTVDLPPEDAKENATENAQGGAKKRGKKSAADVPQKRPKKNEPSPEQEASGEGVEVPGDLPVLSVSQLTRHIRGLLEESLPMAAVEGELSNVKRAASGHVYFNLKDEGAQIRCVMFRAAAASLRFDPEDGLQVILRGRLSVYEQRGEYQIIVLVLEPKGAGALQLAFEQLKRRLEAEGLFDPARKRPLPYLPRAIGLVTSQHGAAIRDVLQVLERRFPGLPVLIRSSAVQGEQAAEEIAQAIADLNRVAGHNHLDVIIVGRGGGSVEDLWAFNTEVVARAIAASKVPVVSAVGHEVDFTIADFVADLRAPTPSAAAELVVPVRLELLAGVQDLRARLLNRIAGRVRQSRERWEGLRARLDSPEALLGQMAQQLDALDERLVTHGFNRMARWRDRIHSGSQRLALLRPDRFNKHHRANVRQLERRLAPALRRHVGTLRERLAAQMELLGSLGPLTVLKRGFAVVRRPDGFVVRSVTQAQPGDDLRVHLQDGSLDLTVRGLTKGEKQD